MQYVCGQMSRAAPYKEPVSRLPAAASCLGRHAHPAGRSPNSSSLFLPLAAVVAVAQGLSPAGLFGGSMLFESTLAAPFARQIKQKLRYPLDTGVLGGAKQPKSEPLPSGASSRGLAVKSSDRVHALFTSSLDQGHHGSTFQRIFHGRHVIFRLIQHQVYFTFWSNHLIIYLHSIRTLYFYPNLLHNFPVYFHPTGCNQHISITT